MVYSKFKIRHNQIGGKKELQEQALKLKLVKEKLELYNLSELDLLDLPEMYNYTKIQSPTWQHDLTNECRRFEDSLFASWMYIALAIFADQMMVNFFIRSNTYTGTTLEGWLRGHGPPRIWGFRKEKRNRQSNTNSPSGIKILT